MRKSIGMEFLEMTKLKNLYESDQALGEDEPPIELECGGGKKIIELPEPKSIDMGAFLDDEINEALSIDGKSQFTLYMATVGKKRL